MDKHSPLPWKRNDLSELLDMGDPNIARANAALIIESVNNYAALKASYRELLILAKDLHYEKFQRSGHMEKGCDCEVWAAIARAQEVTK